MALGNICRLRRSIKNIVTAVREAYAARAAESFRASMNAFSYALAVRARTRPIKDREPDQCLPRTLAVGTNLLDHMKLGGRAAAATRGCGGKSVSIRSNPCRMAACALGRRCGTPCWLTINGVQEKFPRPCPSPAFRRQPAIAATHGDHCAAIFCSAPAVIIFATAFPPATNASPDRGCAALHGFNRIHAVLGTSEKCIATHPSDMDAGHDQRPRCRGQAWRCPKAGEAVPLHDFYVAYGENPAKRKCPRARRIDHQPSTCRPRHGFRDRIISRRGNGRELLSLRSLPPPWRSI